jgi:hypothetical protein
MDAVDTPSILFLLLLLLLSLLLLMLLLLQVAATPAIGAACPRPV